MYVCVASGGGLQKLANDTRNFPLKHSPNYAFPSCFPYGVASVIRESALNLFGKCFRIHYINKYSMIFTYIFYFVFLFIDILRDLT